MALGDGPRDGKRQASATVPASPSKSPRVRTRVHEARVRCVVEWRVVKETKG